MQVRAFERYIPLIVQYIVSLSQDIVMVDKSVSQISLSLSLSLSLFLALVKLLQIVHHELFFAYDNNNMCRNKDPI